MTHPPGARRLLLHVGMGKTGSSALQVAFVRHRDLLRRHGVDYPAADSDAAASAGGVTSGNGMRLARHLVDWLTADEDTPAYLEQLTHELVGSSSTTTLVSSEFLYHLDAAVLRELVDRAAAQGVVVEVAVHLRDVAGHALSTYAQEVKRGGCTLTLGQYLRPGPGVRYRPALRRTLRALRAAVGPAHLHLTRYDAVRPRLVPDFFERLLGVPTRHIPEAVPAEVNRSLTRTEVTLMRDLNRRVADRSLGKRASDALVRLPPLRPEGWSVTPAQAQLLERRFGASVAWVNELAPYGGPLGVLGGVLVAPGVPGATLDERHHRLLDWVAELVRAEPPGQ